MHDPVAFATVLLVLVTAGLWFTTFLLWRSTVTLAKDAKQDASVQADKMERSIAEAAKAAEAMQSVAESTKVNTEQIIRSVEMQRRFGEMHLRARLDVQIGTAVYQSANTVWEAIPRILNTGNWTAQKIKWRIAADILPIPLPEGWRFKLPAEVGGSGSIAANQDGYMSARVDKQVPADSIQDVKQCNGQGLYAWGFIAYDDGFGRTRRRTFAQLLRWAPTGEVNPDGTAGEIVRGVYLKHNHGN